MASRNHTPEQGTISRCTVFPHEAHGILRKAPPSLHENSFLRTLGTAMFLALFLLSVFPTPGWAKDRAGILKLDDLFKGYDGEFILQKLETKQAWKFRPEACNDPTSPCSTFKIPNTLIALETGVASGRDFLLPWDHVQRPIPPWNRDHTLISAFRASCVWFFQEVARRIGETRMAKYLAEFEYGNKDISGGITKFWLESSLSISPNGQVAFLDRLLAGHLPVSPRSLAILKEGMLYRKEKGYQWYGKTGTGGDPIRNTSHLGWYVGFLEGNGGTWIFTTRIRARDGASGRKARAMTVAILTRLMGMGILPGRS